MEGIERLSYFRVLHWQTLCCGYLSMGSVTNNMQETCAVESVYGLLDVILTF